MTETNLSDVPTAERRQLIDLIRSRRHELDESWQIADAILEAGYRLAGAVPDTGQARETARHREGPGAGWPRVAGRCPGCNRASLFLAAGEHVTCSHLDCPAPCAADDLLHPVTPSGDTVPVPTAEIAGLDGAA